jgi:Zn-dependent protease
MLQQLGPQLLLLLIPLALFGLRARVNVGVSVFVRATPERVWEIVNPHDGKLDDWGRVKVVSRRIDGPGETYEISYTSPGNNGVMRTSTALFGVAKRDSLQSLVMKREGLEGKSINNELLEIRHDLKAVAGGTRLTTRYFWGPRQLLAQILARADLWGGVYRLKGLAETGKPDERTFHWINIIMAVVTGLISVAAFGLLVDIRFAPVLVIALAVHEFGHMLAFRMIGQPWGRMLFLPFLGAIAVPRLPFDSQAQNVFAALMGPGFSIFLAIGCIVPGLLGWPSADLFAVAGLVVSGLNVFNMLPAEPLDGGIALRSVLARLFGGRAWLGLLACALLIMGAGFVLNQSVLVLFGMLAVVFNLKSRKIDSGLAPLTLTQVCIAILGYAFITMAHYSLLYRFILQIGV